MPPRKLAHYEILAPLGAGGMGEVYRARDLVLGRDVALKILPEDVAADEHRRARFEREAKALAALSHPNILAIHDFGSEGETTFAVTELLDGATLRSHLDSGTLSPRKAVGVAVQIAAGLTAAHEKGIVHRDLKPENVFVTTDDRVKILDFGLARVTDGSGEPEGGSSTEFFTSPGAVLGTVQYMSPEQVRGETADSRADIFAFGILLYEMFTGEHPFRRPSPGETMSAILREEPAEDSGEWKGMPEPLRRIVLRCLNKNVQGRFQTASDLTYSLEGAASGVTDTPAEAPATRRMVVVLPFENLGPPEEDYFADGITEEITSRLAEVSDLGVISRTSAVQYERKGKTIREIGRDLGAGYVLEGTVRWDRRSGSRVRITPQLIRVSDDTHIWTERYDRVLDDIFAVQSDIAEEVIGHLEANLVETGGDSLEAKPTANLEAYQAYLRGLGYSSEASITESDIRLAIKMFQKAVQLDPEFAQAWARLSLEHSSLYVFGYDMTPGRADMAREAADRVSELAPGSYSAHLAQGFYYYRCVKDYGVALRDLESASERRPRDARLLASISYIQRRKGDWQESARSLEAAIELDGKNAVRLGQLALTMTWIREYERAEDLFRRSILLLPDQEDSYLERATNLWLWDGLLGRAAEALSGIPGQEAPRVVFAWCISDMYRRDWKSVLERLSRSATDVFSDQDGYHPRSLLESRCLRALGDVRKADSRASDALSVLEMAMAENPEDARILSSLGQVQAEMGRSDEALEAAKRLVELAPVERDAITGTVAAVDCARILAHAGEAQGALDRLEHLLSVPSRISPAILRLDPSWDPLREEPRFRGLLG